MDLRAFFVDKQKQGVRKADKKARTNSDDAKATSDPTAMTQSLNRHGSPERGETQSPADERAEPTVPTQLPAPEPAGLEVTRSNPRGHLRGRPLTREEQAFHTAERSSLPTAP